MTFLQSLSSGRGSGHHTHVPYHPSPADLEALRAAMAPGSHDVLVASGETEGLSDRLLTRWLVARKGDLKAAHDMLQKHVDWRKQYYSNGRVKEEQYVAHTCAFKPSTRWQPATSTRHANADACAQHGKCRHRAWCSCCRLHVHVHLMPPPHTHHHTAPPPPHPPGGAACIRVSTILAEKKVSRLDLLGGRLDRLRTMLRSRYLHAPRPCVLLFISIYACT